MVSLLLQHGANPNTTNNDGRSALMEAALWGRLESVKVLLKANADKSLRDREGSCAMDLAQPARKNEKERYRRSSYAAAKSVPERDRDRRHIILLNDSNVEKQHGYTGPLLESEQKKYSFRKSESEMSITLYGPMVCYIKQKLKKTRLSFIYIGIYGVFICILTHHVCCGD
jgi:Ankyrin repeats (many copies)